ncbi:flagellin, partial [Alphaproteobacteria bacterium]|nr:flagellin [Alphaproteobacteria bacterium]
MNVAIRNSQDGISLVQTAEAGMGEITNMIIRMRELSVQMNNGVYTDADRTNAQLEVTALLAEIDKIATNTAFNDVKVLDGSYQKDLRAGNTNVEVIGVNIKRMNTDSLGGTTISSTATTTAVAADRTSTSNTQSSIVASAVESTKIELKADKLSDEMQAFATANAGGTYTISGTNSSLYQVNGTTIESQAAVAYDTAAGATNSHTFDVTYTSGANVFKDSVTLNITQNTDSATVKAATTVLTAAEATAMSFKSVESAAAAADGVLSSSLQTFVSANTAGATNGGWSVSGTDASSLSISTAGVVTVTGGTDYETKTSYSFNVEFATNTGDKFVEAVTLGVSDLAEREYTVATPYVPSTVAAGDKFTVTADGQSIVATMANSDAGAFTIANLASKLNTANAALGTPADGTFSVNNTNDIVFKFNDKATAQTGTVSSIQFEANAPVVASSVQTNGAVTARVVTLADHGTPAFETAMNGSAADGDKYVINIGGQDVAYTLSATGNGGASDTTHLQSLGSLNERVAYLAGKLDTAANTAGVASADIGFGITASGSSFLVTANTAGTAANAAVVGPVRLDPNGGGAEADLGAAASDAAGTDTPEVLQWQAPTLPTTASGDKFSVTIDNNGSAVTVTTGVLGASAALAAVKDALNTAHNNVNGTFSVSGNDLRFTYNANQGNVTNTNDGALKYIPQAGTVSNSTAGVGQPALTAATQSTSTAGTATAQRAGNFAARSSTEIVQAKSTISLVESAKIKFDKTAMSTGFSTYVAAHTGGKYTLTGTDAKSFSIDQTSGMVKNELNMDFETKASFNINVVYTDTNSKTFTEAVNLVLTDSTADSGTHLDDLNVGTQSGAASAITILDTALNQISASQAELGAIQNRLQHNIDNLSMGSMLTETARGRIVDADFAQETSELSKQQILSQAATSMLAQA